MAARRRTLEDDVDRLAERVFNDAKGNIVDKTTFDFAFDKYLEDEDVNARQNNTLRRKVFDSLRMQKKGIVKERKFKAVKGQIQPARKPKIDEKQFTQLGTVKQKIVFGKPVTIRIKKGKPFVRFRDKKGRFIKITR